MESRGLSAVDWVIVAAFLGGVLVLGLLAAGRQRSVRDYFLGGRSLPWWAVALSIIATETSSATYIGMPGMAYGTSWHFLQMVAGFLIARICIATFFLKAFYRADVVTVYGFLRERFGEGTRAVAAVLFLLGRVVGSGVRLYAACLALGVAAGWKDGASTLLAIAALGLIALAYTLLGGIKAVVWTECVLAGTFLLGGLVAAGLLIAGMPGGLEAAAGLPEFADKLRVIHLAPPPGGSWLTSEETLPISLAGGFFLSLATHGTDQDIVQRMLTCPDARRGGKSLISSALLMVPIYAIFLAVGSLLYFSHRLATVPPPDLPSKDLYFLHFIRDGIPHGLAGLVLAGLFAAAVSSHTSVLNALASTAVADFYRPYLVKGASEEHYLRASRVFTAAWGILLIAVAAAFVGSGENILKVALRALTYFYGGLLGIFLLGLFTGRGNSASTTAGMIVSVPAVLLLQARAFIEDPGLAPSAVQAAIEALPGWAVEGLRGVPLLAWPLWIVIGAGIAFGIGALGRPRSSPRQRMENDRGGTEAGGERTDDDRTDRRG
jgi:SSS family solute:Na+ symporter